MAEDTHALIKPCAQSNWLAHVLASRNLEEAYKVQSEVGASPASSRPSFTMGGTGGGIAYNREEFEEICTRGLDLSPTKELLIDESLIG